MKKLEEGQNQPQIAEKPSKLHEIIEKREEDVMSALPDCLLLEILSRLTYTKDAVRTSALSKRWAHLWTWLPTLAFSFNDVFSQALKNPGPYILSFDKTLTQCRRSKLKMFNLHVPYDSLFESLFNKWICYATSCNVEDLCLDFWHTGREAEFWLDQSLFINSHLTDMELLGCMLNPIGVISWPNLRSLTISHMYLDEDLVLNLLCGCPLLETLFLRESNICENSEAETEADIININAPKSLSLNRCPQLNLKTFRVSTYFDIDFESQLNSWIGYAIRCNVKTFILKFSDTETGYELMLDQIVFTSSCFTEVKLKGCLINPVGKISWKNLRSLCISSWNLNKDLINNILQGSPVLESLELDKCYGYKRLDITSKSVKNLVIDGYKNPLDESESDIIEINAPNILSLAINDNIFLWKFLNVQSLVKAELNYWCTKLEDRHRMPKEEWEEEILKGYIMSLGHVKELQIGDLCSEAVFRLQAQGFIFPSNVKFYDFVFEDGYQK